MKFMRVAMHKIDADDIHFVSDADVEEVVTVDDAELLKGVWQEPRRGFALLTIERNERTLEDRRIARAAAKTQWSVDAETVGLFRKYNLPLPARLSKGTWE